jgi:hypothetical protein
MNPAEPATAHELHELADFDADVPDVRAPTAEQWAALTPEEREQVVASLPTEVVHNFMVEGDHHAAVVLDARDMLRSKYGGGGRRSLYLGLSVMVYYPGARSFAPDLFGVFDVHDHLRDSWVVSAEGRGLDVAIEVHWKGSQRKDMVENVSRYAQLGIPEYFVLDRTKMRIAGFRLPPGGSVYRPILPQGGRYESVVLGVWLAAEETQFRFYEGDAALATQGETIGRLTHAMRTAEVAAEAFAARADEEAARADEEAARANEEAARANEEAARANEEAARALDALTRADAERSAREALQARIAELERQLAERGL